MVSKTYTMALEGPQFTAHIRTFTVASISEISCIRMIIMCAKRQWFTTICTIVMLSAGLMVTFAMKRTFQGLWVEDDLFLLIMHDMTLFFVPYFRLLFIEYLQKFDIKLLQLRLCDTKCFDWILVMGSCWCFQLKWNNHKRVGVAMDCHALGLGSMTGLFLQV